MHIRRLTGRTGLTTTQPVYRSSHLAGPTSSSRRPPPPSQGTTFQRSQQRRRKHHQKRHPCFRLPGVCAAQTRSARRASARSADPPTSTTSLPAKNTLAGFRLEGTSCPALGVSPSGGHTQRQNHINQKTRAGTPCGGSAGPVIPHTQRCRRSPAAAPVRAADSVRYGAGKTGGSSSCQRPPD